MFVDFRSHPTFTDERATAKLHDNISLKHPASAVHIT